jgi:replicative DNA helicase
MNDVTPSQSERGIGLGDLDSVTTANAFESLRLMEQQIRRGHLTTLELLPTGFQPLDRYLEGGLRPGDLILIGGAPGVGKTTLTLQMARNIVARTPSACLYVCYEHQESYLLQRLIALESFVGRDRADAEVLSVNEVRQRLFAATRALASQNGANLESMLTGSENAATALARLDDFGRRLYVVKVSGDRSGIEELRQRIRDLKDRHRSQVAVFVDYLQKVPVFPAAPDEAELTTRVANELKELALSEDVPVVATVAANGEGLQAQRLRMHHFRGTTSLAYEADLALVLNNKYRIVAKRAIAFNPHQAQEFRDWFVLTIEKNRSGRDMLDLEFRAWFGHAAFDPNGKVVEEALVDERLDE